MQNMDMCITYIYKHNDSTNGTTEPRLLNQICRYLLDVGLVMDRLTQWLWQRAFQ